MKTEKKFKAGAAIAMTTFLLAQVDLHGEPPASKDLAQQIFDTMLQVHGVAPAQRPVHAKGLVCQGTFTPSAEAASLSTAPHFQKGTTPVTIRLSDGAPNPHVPDFSPEAGPRGFAIRFKLPSGGKMDIVAISHNGFVVATGEEFLELQKSVVATDPSKPHPWPVEVFLGSHPLALKFVLDNRVIPSSFANEAFFANNALLFINKDGVKRPGRFKILPLAGEKNLSEADAKAKSPDFLIDDLKGRLAKEPVKYRLVVQLANPGDATKDPSLVWPDDRKAIEVGIISVVSVVPDDAAAEKALAYDPTNLSDGIDLSDDLLPALRSEVYALSRHRRQK